MASVRQILDGVRIGARRLTASRRPLPDFLVIGAQKAGTSTLFARLAALDGVVAPIRREVHYFDLNASRGPSWYRAHFPVARGRATPAIPHRAGESSPYYLFHPGVPGRVRALLPDVALVAILREPVSRAVSEYHHAVRHGFETRTIGDALDCAAAPDERTLASMPLSAYDDPTGALRRHSYLPRGRYAEQLRRWLDVFPREQLLVLETVDLRSDAGLESVARFLGVDPTMWSAPRDRNTQRYDAPPPDLVARLTDYYAPHDAALAELLGSAPTWTADR